MGEDKGPAQYEIKQIVALHDSKVFKLRYTEYAKFANREDRAYEPMMERLINNLPGLINSLGSHK